MIGKTHAGRCLAALAGIAVLTGMGSLANVPAARALDSPAPAVADAESGSGILSESDAATYRRIFAAQKAGHWQTADDLIDTLTDDLLLGTILAERYLPESHYRVRVDDLSEWLADFGDLPEAPAIHKLARRLAPRAALPAPEPVDALTGRGGIDGGEVWLRGQNLSHLNPADARHAASLTRQFRQALRRGKTLTARRLLTDTPLPHLLTAVDFDRLRGALGFSYFLDGRDGDAARWADAAADRSGPRAPLASWTAGLAAWRSGDFARAERRFGTVARSRVDDPWMRSGGAYWAARAALHARHPQEVNDWLAIAAEHSRTFYGLIACRALGLPTGLGWSPETLSREDRETLAQYPGGRRALALLQIGERDRAEAELRRLFPSLDPQTQQTVVAVADASGLAGLALRLGQEMQRRQGVIYDTMRYPIPAWVPEGGWSVDRALVYAFTRQESGFDPQAKSRAGARGLMQLMPATARFISQAAGQPARPALEDPGVNLALGQQYLALLLGDEGVGGNLFFLAAAYNAGPGNLTQWRRNRDLGDDPLLFIEVLPSRETRLYIERVLANLWIYRMRLHQDTPSLDDLAAGRWPLYVPLDRLDMRVAARSTRG